MIIKATKIVSLIERFIYSKETLARRAGVKLGEHNFIASRFWSSEPYLITIGSNCQITAGVKIFTHGGAAAVRHIDSSFDVFGKVSIGDYCYIGCNALIMPGVQIGNNVLIAAGSVVVKSVPSNCVIGGNPARYICSIQDYMNRNMKYNTKSKGMSFAEKKKYLMTLNDNMFVIKQKMQF